MGETAQAGGHIVVPRHNVVEAHLRQGSHAHLGGDVGVHGPGDAVAAALNRLAQGHGAAGEAAHVRVLTRRLGRIHIHILHDGGGAVAVLQGGGVDDQRLDGAAGLAEALVGAVQAVDIRLLAPSAHDGRHLPRLIVDEGGRPLQGVHPVGGGLIVEAQPLVDGLLQILLLLRIQGGVHVVAADVEFLPGGGVGLVVLLRILLIFLVAGEAVLKLEAVQLHEIAHRAVHGVGGLIIVEAVVRPLDDDLLLHRRVVLLLGDVLHLQHIIQDLVPAL